MVLGAAAGGCSVWKEGFGVDPQGSDYEREGRQRGYAQDVRAASFGHVPREGRFGAEGESIVCWDEMWGRVLMRGV